ncbi:hypothetical protein ACWT_1885 [Actinoplanes sp. SE50]|uniref:hypothetical protein n=1 Tax=unclassified Actinoplanes TaxID=2626549 RepID=UPI00023EBCEE|nr:MULTISPECIES: hypothetical protein [unclassified Actinoplanes]AEV82904.1 hypothetical protein ACPL_2007 [Actinoplanes sp. SE50/110]ATO81300.1 hypothetical protein ACWT_1885 [Actinoplanes sp. SE50]SLL98707.1 hypothetical protein ACSP50_1934 [Actinoplanes sp. SE50/110]
MGLLDRFVSPRRRFAALAVRVARRTPGVDRAVSRPDDFSIAIYRTGATGPAHLYLANIFRETEGATPAERRERLAKLVRIMAAPPPQDDWETVRPKLRPVLRPVTFGSAGPPGMRPPISRAALPYLKELVVVDQPEAMAYVVPDRVDEWGVSAEEVFTQARENLAGMARTSLDQPWPSGQPLISMLDDGDAYFTSLLLAPGWLAEVGERLGGPVLAFAPDNNTLLLCPLPETTAEPFYALVDQHFKEAPRSLSPVGYVAGPQGRTIAYTPPLGHPHHLSARRAEMVLALTEYQGQTNWLAEQYAQAGVDVHIGGLLSAEPIGGLPETIAVWTAGVSTLLPKADAIVFVHPDSGPQFSAPWDAVARRVTLEAEPLLAPARYRVDDWPAPDILASLRQEIA